MPIFYGKSKDLSFVPSNRREWLDFLENSDGKQLEVSIKRTTGVRTSTQNNSLHKYFELVAKELNNAGFPIQMVLQKFRIDIEWDTEKVKELIWRPVQQMITGKKSTTKLDKVSEIDMIYDHVNRFLAEQCNGLHVDFPNSTDKAPLKY